MAIIVLGLVQLNLKAPVSWTIPRYRHSAVSLLILSGFIRKYRTSHAELALASTKFFVQRFNGLLIWWSMLHVLRACRMQFSPLAPIRSNDGVSTRNAKSTGADSSA